MNVGEIAAPAAGNQDFLSDSLATLQNGHAASALPGLDRAEESRGPGAKNQNIKFVDQGFVSRVVQLPSARFLPP
jgi:hypothetical protein